MKKKLLACVAAALCLAVLLFAGLAEAKRLGGGSSFGSRPSYSRSYTKPVSPSSGSSTQPTSPQQVQPAPAAPLAGPQQPGMFSRLGWGMGGFLAGGLLGSMLFGGGGMGWGGGIGLLDILLIGLGVYLLVKLLRRRGPGPVQDPQDMPPPQAPPAGVDPRTRAEQGWNALRSTPPPQSSTGTFGNAPLGQEGPAEPVVPQGFNVQEFLEGAKTVYARLQHSWDRRDLRDIALFTTPEVLAEISRQAASDPTPSKTELLLVNARLLEFREEDKDTVATVLFDVLLREDASEERPKQVREVWHFSRPTGDVSANWRLEGIQQLET